MAGKINYFRREYYEYNDFKYIKLKAKLPGLTKSRVAKDEVKVDAVFKDTCFSLTVTGLLGHYELPFNGRPLYAPIDPRPGQSYVKIEKDWIKVYLKKKVAQKWADKRGEIMLLAPEPDSDDEMDDKKEEDLV
ncbi:uncharacterized protein LOC144434620 [Glandiceps talaboti]